MGSDNLFWMQDERDRKGRRYDSDKKTWEKALADIGASLSVVELALSRADGGTGSLKEHITPEIGRIRAIVEEHLNK